MQYHKTRDLYRHNYEYDIHALIALIHAAGFELSCLETHDVFQPTIPEAIALLNEHPFEKAYRGDCIFLVAHKVSAVKNRWPEEVYV